MLRIIIMESKTPDEFARRAEAWSSSQAKPMTDVSMIDQLCRDRPVFVTHHKAGHRTLLPLISRCRAQRLAVRDKLWGSLIQDAV